MRRGRIVETGTHEELLAAAGVYAQIRRRQHDLPVDRPDPFRAAIPERLRSVPLLRRLPPARLRELAACLAPATFGEREPIIRAGGDAQRFYIIVQGTALRDGEALEDGDCFGDEALLGAELYMTSVDALTACTCLVLDRARAAWLRNDVQIA